MSTTQRELLTNAETYLGVGPVDMARELGTPYSTYKKWRAEQRTMPAVGLRCLELRLRLKEIDDGLAEIA